MVKMAKIYSYNFVPGDGMPASNLSANIDLFKGLLSPSELLKLHKMVDLLSGRSCNFKHMMDLLNADDIMGKFKSPAIEQDGINLEDLEAGLNQMGFPLLRIIVKNYKGSTDNQGHQLYKAVPSCVDTVFAEMDAISNMNVGHKPSSLLRDINTRDLVDAATRKAYYAKKE